MAGRLYTKSHEWLTVDGKTVTVGITDFAQSQLGDVVFLELPKPGEATRTSLTKSEKKVDTLIEKLNANMPTGTMGIGHTRWATHGKPTYVNAHPHTDCHGKIFVVHNGIIENFAELKAELEAKGHEFTSETDTEVVPHLIESYYKGDFLAAVRAALKRVKGA